MGNTKLLKRSVEIIQSLYIAGPYTAPDREGEDRNILAAAEVAAEYLRLGWRIFCPHTMTSIIDREFNRDGTLQHADWMELDLYWLEKCDAIYMLPGWRNSKGAQQEYTMARALGKTIMGEVE